MRVLAVDFGTRRIGVAVSDEGAVLARPLAVVDASRGRKAALRAVGRFVEEYRPGEIVVGNPRGLDRGEGTLAGEAAAFAAQLREMFGVEVRMWDERLSTHEAGEKLREAGAGRRARRAKIDQAAAAVILQGYLDFRSGGGR